MYTCSLVSVFCVKQLKFEISIILCQYSYHSFLYGFKNKNKFGELTFPTAFSSHQVLGTKGVGYVIDIPWIVLLYYPRASDNSCCCN